MSSVDFIRIITFIFSYFGILIWIFLWLMWSHRLLAIFVNIILRIYVRFFVEKRASTYIRIKSVYLAPLGGKLFFKGLRVVNDSMSLFVLDGSVTLSWWLLFKKKFAGTSYESRLRFHISGVEGIVYNNSSVYDAVMSKKKKNDRGDFPATRKEIKDIYHKSFGDKFIEWARTIGVRAKKVNLLIGNSKLKTIVQASTRVLTGVMGYKDPEDKQDKCRMIVEAKCDDMKVSFVRNNDIILGHLEHHLKVMEHADDSVAHLYEHFKSVFQKSSFDCFDQAAFSEENNISKVKYPHNYIYPPSYFKNRNLFTSKNESDLFECNQVRFSFFRDSPGIQSESLEDPSPPKQSLEISFGKFKNNAITYGPWGDHQRSIIQTFFFPQVYTDQEDVLLQQGKVRKHQHFDIKVEFTQALKWTLPFIRTPKTQQEKLAQKGSQEYMVISLGAGSIVKIKSPLGNFSDGSRTDVKITSNTVKIITSNTKNVFIQCQEFDATWVLKYGIKWNSPREYEFTWDFHEGTMYYLWEHTSFFRDLARCWTNWENQRPSTLLEFVPTHYKWAFRGFNVDVMMSAQWNNIIDKYNSDENQYALVYCPRFEFIIQSNFDKFQPLYSVYEYDVNVKSSEEDPDDMPHMEMIFPTDHPLFDHVKGENKIFLTGERGLIHGKYTSHSKVHTNVLDSIELDIDFYDVLMNCNGAYIRLFITWYINHFAYCNEHLSSEEFALNGHKNDKARQLWLMQVTNKVLNRLPYNSSEVCVNMGIHRGKANVPTNLHATQEAKLVAFCEELLLEVRAAPKYLDLLFDISAVTCEFPPTTQVSRQTLHNKPTAPHSKHQTHRRTFAGTDSIKIAVQCLTGPPPDSNYYKMTLDFKFGNVQAEVLHSEAKAAIKALQAFATQWGLAFPEMDPPDPVYNDREFVPEQVVKNRPLDVTVTLDSINAILLGSQGDVVIALDKEITYQYNSLNDRDSNSRHNFELKSLLVNVLKKQSNSDQMLSVGRLETSLSLQVKNRRPTILHDFQEQQAFLRVHEMSDFVGSELNSNDGHTLDMKSQLSQSDVLLSERSDYISDVEDLSDDDGMFFDAESDSGYSSGYESPDTEHVPHLETVAGEKIALQKHVLEQINMQLLDQKQTKSQNRSSTKLHEVPDEVIFFNDEKNGKVRSESYRKYLRSYQAIRESDQAVTPLLFSCQEDSNLPDIYNTETGLGLSSHLPHTVYQETTKPHVKRIHQGLPKPDDHPLKTPQPFRSPDMSTYDQNTSMYNQSDGSFMSPGPDMNGTFAQEDLPPSLRSVQPDTVEMHAHLQFGEQITVMACPDVAEILCEVVANILNPITDNLSEVADLFEQELRSRRQKKKKPQQPKKDKKAFPLFKLILSCNISNINVNIIQGLKLPNILENSPLLGRTLNFCLKLSAKDVAFVAGLTWSKKLQKPEEFTFNADMLRRQNPGTLVSELTLIEGILNIKHISALMQCLDKVIHRGVGVFDLGDGLQSSLIPGAPVVLAAQFEDVRIKTMNPITDEIQGRFSINSGKSLQLLIVQEIPVIFYAMYEVWLSTIQEQKNFIQTLLQKKKDVQIMLLVGLSALDDTDHLDHPETLNEILVSIEQIPPYQALMNVRERLRNLEEGTHHQKIVDLILSLLITSGARKKLMQQVSYQFSTLLEEKLERGADLLNNSKSLLDKTSRIDLFVQLEEIMLSLHAHNQKSVKRSNAIFEHVELRGKFESITEQVHRFDANSFFLNSPLNKKTTAKQREMSLVVSLIADSLSFDIHPRGVQLVTAITGIVLGLRSYLNLKKKKLKDEQVKRFKHFLKRRPTRNGHQRSRTMDDLSGKDMRMGLDEPQPESTRSPPPPLPQSSRKLYLFANVLIKEAKARAWKDEGISFAELFCEKVSFCVNLPKVDPLLMRQMRAKKSLLIESSAINVEKISVQYNYAAEELGHEIPDFISIFEAGVSKIDVHQFYFEREKSDNILVYTSIGGGSVKIPYTDIWGASSLQFRRFVMEWINACRVKPFIQLNVDAQQQIDQPTSEDLESPREGITANWSMPNVALNFDLKNLEFYFKLLPELQMKYQMSQIIAMLGKEAEEYSYRLHIFKNALSFQTDKNSFVDVHEMTLDPKMGKTQFLLPQVLAHGLFKRDQDSILKTDVTVEYSENVLTAEIANYVMSVQENFFKEVANIVNVLNEGKLSKRIRTELPKAQASVASIKLKLDFNLFIEGMRFSVIHHHTSGVFDTGTIHVSGNNMGQDIEWKIQTQGTSIQALDMDKLKFSRTRGSLGHYSITENCYVWASAKTNILIMNAEGGEEEDDDEKSQKGEKSKTQKSGSPDEPSKSFKKVFVRISDTNIYLRPGSHQVIILLIKDYQEVAKGVLKKTAQNLHLQRKAFESLIRTAEERYAYYSTKLVETVSKNPSILIYSVFIQIMNTRMTIPMGDNPYYGFLNRENISFSPTHVACVVVKEIGITTTARSHDDGKPKENSSSSKRVQGLIQGKTIQLYIQKSKPNNILTQTYPPEEFENCSNRMLVENIIFNVDFTSLRNILRTTIQGKIGGPIIQGDPNIMIHLINFQKDWFSGRGEFSRTADIFRFLNTKQIQQATAKATSTTSTSIFKSKLHINCRMIVEEGKIRLNHTLDIPVNQPWGSDSDSEQAVVATLPSAQVSILHISPPLLSGEQASRLSSTHLQLTVHWKGATLQPKSVLFLKELWDAHRARRKKRKKPSFARKSKDLLSNRENSIQPMAWMQSVTSVIEIQRIWRGYLVRKVMKDLRSAKQLHLLQSKKKASKDHRDNVSLRKNTISFLCRIQPFKIIFTCKPVSNIVTSFEFSKPFDFLFSRAHRHVQNGLLKGDSLYNTVFLTSPEIILRMYHELSPPDLISVRIRGVMANAGTGYGSYLRPDGEAVVSGTCNIELVQVNFNLPQINQFFLAYSLWMEKLDEARDALADEITQQTGKIINKHIQLNTETSFDATMSKFGQIFVKRVEVRSNLDYQIGKQNIEIDSISVFLRDRGRFYNSPTRDPLHFGGYIGSMKVDLNGKFSGRFSMNNGVALGLNRTFRVTGSKPVNHGCSNFCFRILPIELELDYNMDKILTFLTGEMVVKFRDVFSSKLATMPKIEAVFSSDSVIARLSSMTGPVFIKLYYQLLKTLHQRRQTAMKTLQESAYYYSGGTQFISGLRSDTQSTFKQLKIPTPIEQFKKLNIMGQITILGKDLFVFVHDRFALDENRDLRLVPGRTNGEFLGFSVLKYRFQFNRICKLDEDCIQREIQLFLANMNAERMSTKRKFILQVPGASLNMLSEQTPAQNLIKYRFKSKWPEPIKVTTNLSEYNFFRKVLNFYYQSVKKELNVHKTEVEEHDMTEGLTETTLTDPAESLSEIVQQEFIGKTQLNPKLNVLGDMTPTVDTVLAWLGIDDKNLIPRITHMTVTNSMEAMLIGCSNASSALNRVLNEKQSEQ